jgi:hypothetical protein
MDRPEAILITFPLSMVKEGGGYKAFLSTLEELNQVEGSCWLNKCRNKPKHDVLYVYGVIGGKVRCRFVYAGYGTGPVDVIRANGTRDTVSWSRLILTGPVVMAPIPIDQRGFQGFRYTDKLLF